MATILIVDDRRDSELVLVNQLKSRGFAVRTLSDPLLVLETIQGGGIDAILMDMNMPEMDGCEATQLVKADANLRHIPIIICTSHPMAGDEQRARDAGCDGFIAKPLVMETVLNLMGTLFQTPPQEHNPAPEPLAASDLQEEKSYTDGQPPLKVATV
jgi:two-component system, cell cycle response regulator DivK